MRGAGCEAPEYRLRLGLSRHIVGVIVVRLGWKRVAALGTAARQPVRTNAAKRAVSGNVSKRLY
jgi:hypothetical protein